MAIAADLGVEEHPSSRHVHFGAAGNEVPRRGEIPPASGLVERGVDGYAIEINWRATRTLRSDDGAESFFSPNDDRLTVGRPGGRGVVMAVVGKPDFAVEIDDSQVTAFTCTVALMQVCDERDERESDSRDILDIDAEVRMARGAPGRHEVGSAAGVASSRADR